MISPIYLHGADDWKDTQTFMKMKGIVPRRPPMKASTGIFIQLDNVQDYRTMQAELAATKREYHRYGFGTNEVRVFIREIPTTAANTKDIKLDLQDRRITISSVQILKNAMFAQKQIINC